MAEGYTRDLFFVLKPAASSAATLFRSGELLKR
jgi:hypothetical protein